MACFKARIHEALYDLHGALDQYDKALETYERAFERNQTSDLAADLATVYMSKGDVLRRLGRHRTATTLYDKCLAVYLRVEKQGNKTVAPGLAAAYRKKGQVIAELRKARLAISAFDHSILVYERLVHKEGHQELFDELAQTYMHKANALASVEDDRAPVLYDRCIAIYEQLVYEQDRADLSVELARAYISKAVNSLEYASQAISLYDQSIAIYRGLLGNGRYDLANELAKAYSYKAAALKDIGDQRKSRKLNSQCIKMYEELVHQEGRSEFTKELAEAYINSAAALSHTSNYQAAATQYNRAIRIYEHLVEDGQSELVEDLSQARAERNEAVSQARRRSRFWVLFVLFALIGLVAGIAGMTELVSLCIWAIGILFLLLRRDLFIRGCLIVIGIGILNSLLLWLLRAVIRH